MRLELNGSSNLIKEIILGKAFQTLSELGKSPIILGKLQVLPFGGRVLGLYPQENLNVLWTNPALESVASAQTLLGGGQWTNLGGDRTWISPEIELFIPDLDRPEETYQVPSGVDPANYRVLRHCRNEVELETTMTVDFYRNGCKADLLLRKRITALNTPDFPIPDGVDAAGYELLCTLSTPGNMPPAIHPAIWNLMQVPGGGEIIVPLRNRSLPVHFFGRQQYRHEGKRLSAPVPATTKGYKFGLHAHACQGMMLYRNLTATQPYLILRRFTVGSPERYFDVPYNAPRQQGAVQQVYVDDGAYGGFGEMEHHSVALDPIIGANVTDSSTSWAFAGEANRLNLLAEALLVGTD